MSWCAVLVAATLGCPWFRPRRCYEEIVIEVPCVTYVVEERCTPIHSTAETPAETPETTMASAEESVTEPTQFVVPALYSLDMLGLQWGPATLGPGILYPTAPVFSGASVGGILRDPGPDAVPGSPTVVLVPLPTAPPGPAPPDPGSTPLPPLPGGGPPPAPIPEPTAVGIWVVAFALVGRQLRRRAKPRELPEAGVTGSTALLG